MRDSSSVIRHSSRVGRNERTRCRPHLGLWSRNLTRRVFFSSLRAGHGVHAIPRTWRASTRLYDWGAVIDRIACFLRSPRFQFQDPFQAPRVVHVFTRLHDTVSVSDVRYLWSWPRWNSKWPSWQSSTSCGRCTWSRPLRTRREVAPRIRPVSGGPPVSTGLRPSVGCPSTARWESRVSPASHRTCRTSRMHLPCNGTTSHPRRTWTRVLPNTTVWKFTSHIVYARARIAGFGLQGRVRRDLFRSGEGEKKM